MCVHAHAYICVPLYVCMVHVCLVNLFLKIIMVSGREHCNNPLKSKVSPNMQSIVWTDKLSWILWTSEAWAVLKTLPDFSLLSVP